MLRDTRSEDSLCHCGYLEGREIANLLQLLRQSLCSETRRHLGRLTLIVCLQIISSGSVISRGYSMLLKSRRPGRQAAGGKDR